MPQVGGATIHTVKFIDNSPEAKRAMEESEAAALEAVGLLCEGYAKGELNGEFGAPRRIDTGNLLNSVTHEVVKKEDAVYIGTDVEYGIYVHEGTYRMEPNRFIRNSVERHMDEINELVKDTLS